MTNLKAVLDAARAADDELKRILAEMDAAFSLDTEDGRARALELRPALDEAKSKAEQANQLYVSMRDASLVKDNAAAFFVPPADPGAENSTQGKSMSREQFTALNAAARMNFIKSGGTITE